MAICNGIESIRQWREKTAPWNNIIKAKDNKTAISIFIRSQFECCIQWMATSLTVVLSFCLKCKFFLLPIKMHTIKSLKIAQLTGSFVEIIGCVGGGGGGSTTEMNSFHFRVHSMSFAFW